MVAGSKTVGSNEERMDREGQGKPSPRIAVAEVNYDKNPTPLFKLISLKKRESTLDRLLASPEEAGTWVYRQDPIGKLIWRMLPIHAAVLFRAPIDVIRNLLEVFPSGCNSPDDQGFLPLHIAFKTGADDEVLYMLLKCNPKAVQARDSKGRTPVEVCRLNATSKNGSTANEPLDHGCRAFGDVNTIPAGRGNWRIPECGADAVHEEESWDTNAFLLPSFESNERRQSGFELYVSIAVELERLDLSRESRGEVESRIRIEEEKCNNRLHEMRKDIVHEVNIVRESYRKDIDTKETEMDALRSSCAYAITVKDNEIELMRKVHENEIHAMKVEMRRSKMKFERLKQEVQKGFESFLVGSSSFEAETRSNPYMQR